MVITEKNNLKNTFFILQKIDKFSIFKDLVTKIKLLRKMPFHEVFLIFSIQNYDNVYSELEKEDVKVVGFIQNKDNTITMKVS